MRWQASEIRKLLIYFGSYIPSTETNFNIHISKICNPIDTLLTIEKSDLFLKIKRKFFWAVPVLVQLNISANWTPTTTPEKEKENILDRDDTRIFRAVLTKSWKQHTTKKHLYSHLPLISQNTQVRRVTYAVPCWKSQDEFKSYAFQWIPKMLAD